MKATVEIKIVTGSEFYVVRLSNGMEGMTTDPALVVDIIKQLAGVAAGYERDWRRDASDNADRQ